MGEGRGGGGTLPNMSTNCTSIHVFFDVPLGFRVSIDPTFKNSSADPRAQRGPGSSSGDSWVSSEQCA